MGCEDKIFFLKTFKVLFHKSSTELKLSFSEEICDVQRDPSDQAGLA